MKKNLLFMKVIAIFSLCLVLIPTSGTDQKVGAFSNQVVQHGAVGDDVIELQARLQYLGFYNGKIDGVFGWGTYWALRNFQYEFGLPIDGLAGAETKQKLAKASKYNEQFVKEQINNGKKFTHYGGTDLEKQKQPGGGNQQGGNGGGQGGATPAPKPQGNTPEKPAPANPAPAKPKETPQKPTATNVPNGFSQNDIQLMANAVYGEARGEPYTGQVAVAAVILNRVQSASFPNTVSGVIFEPAAFTAVADGQIWLTPNENAKKAVIDAINGWDPTGEALYYFNPDTATSAWIWSRPQIKRIGKHIFCE
ncbi:spore cortex-lytic enzyme [Cytobacillus spongiae]|jgi:N-acetylmuramoyl-L-alanine amidase|uniref:spore cortex-lytic enzyme n=1 Tax=Cytobacillus spongiae TaxID=2901381 RepID=UPI001F326A5E|nr:spore cortex-lytic enzyme [Cytobacillus spongiae]UII54659.1 spore cortex-lytic enzyme [Cytobacillus spongiae]